MLPLWLRGILGAGMRRPSRCRDRRRSLRLRIERLEDRTTPTLVAAYAFSEGTGATVADASGNGHTGTISNATWTTAGRYGDALSFDGTDALVTIPDAADLRLTTGMTLEAWVNPAAVSSDWRDVLYKGDDNYYLEATSTTSSRPAAGAIVDSAYVEAYGTAALAVNTWAHLAATYDGTTLRLYVNGTQVASKAGSGSLLTSTDALQIGGDSLYGQFFKGTIDEVRVYNAALTAAQIQADMNTSIAPDTTPPTAPTNLAATAVGGAQINLSWTASTDNVGVTGYFVERENPGSTTFTQVGTTAGTTYTDAGLSPSSTYSYRVRATDAAGNLSFYSNTAAATTAASTPGLVAAYAFSEGTGATVADASGNGHTGTISNATWSTAGKYGDALSFNGSNALVTVPDAAALHLTTGMTLEAWVNPAVTAAAWRDVIYKGNDNFFLEATSTASAGQPSVGAIVNSAYLQSFGTAALAANTWAHLAATYDGATMRLYVNGTQVASAAGAGSILTSTNALQIGGDSLYGQFFQGLIDEVRVYNVALTAAQIQADMNTPVDINAQDTTPPTAPGSLTATDAGAGQVHLSWQASTDNVAVASYLVEREDPGSSTFVQIGTATGTTYTDPGLTAGNTYGYRVRAADFAGNLSSYSTTAQVAVGFSITPHVATVTYTQAQQFTADSSNVTWSVDGVAGGSASIGTISAAGVYTPPSTVGTHTITATTADQLHADSATVYVTNDAGDFTFHNDTARTGQDLNETVLTPSNVNSSTFGKLFSYDLDGMTFASPLYLANVNIPGKGYHNVVYVATEHDSVYAFDADGLSSTPLWQVSFINPAAGVTTVPAADTGETGDIPNEIGITGTPVIDPATGTLYVVAKTKEVSGGTTTYVQRLHALDITTGAEKLGGPVVIQATVPGTGNGSSGGQLPFSPLHENQRPALLLSNGVVYLGFSSHGDVEPFHGWLLGYDATTLQQVLVFNSAPNGDHGGIWMNGDGPAVDASGNLYFITGDGTLDADTGGNDYGDSFVKLSTSGTVQDYFSPSVQSTLDANDLDLGSGGVLLLPDQSGSHAHEMVSAGKNGTIYLVDRDNMGGFDSSSDHVVQELVNVFTTVTGIEGGNFSSPVYFNGSVYFSPVQDHIQAFGLSNGLLTTSPTSKTATVFNSRGGTLSISANGSSNGILWAVESTGSTTPGILHAYDASKLSTELYNSGQAGTRDTLDVWLKFTLPVVANGKVFVSGVNQLTVYGLLPNPAAPLKAAGGAAPAVSTTTRAGAQAHAAPVPTTTVFTVGGTTVQVIDTVGPTPGALTPKQVQSVFAAALQRWSAAGYNVSRLGHVTVEITNLSAGLLGMAQDTTIWLDANAAGYGWFVDPTPSNDEAFTAPGDHAAKGHMDLLTVLDHELGHLLGLPEGVMPESLPTGTRRTPVPLRSLSRGLDKQDLIFVAPNLWFTNLTL